MPDQKLSLYRSCRATFGIFPAMIPLVEILPWLLGLIGGAAGVYEFLRQKIWLRRGTRWGFIIGAICIVTGVTVFAVHRFNLPSRAVGSAPVNPAKFSETVHTRPASSTAIARADFGEIWNRDMGAILTGTPVIAGDLLMIGTNDETLEAVSVKDGTPRWTIKKVEGVYTSPAIDGDLGIVGEGAHTAPAAVLTAFDIKNGQVKWERKFLSHIESEGRIARDKDIVFQSVGAQGIWALSLSNGDVKWKAEIGHIDVSPLNIDNRLFIVAKLSPDDAVSGSAFFELNPDTGAVIGKTALDGNPMGNLIAGPDGTVLFATAVGQVGATKETDKGWIYSVTRDGVIKWKVPLDTMPLPEGQLSTDGARIYFTLKNGDLVALDTATGQELWMHKYNGEFLSGAVLIEDQAVPMIAAVTTDGYVGILNALTGDHIKSFKVKDGRYAAPIYRDDVLYIPEDRGLRAFGPVSTLVRK